MVTNELKITAKMTGQDGQLQIYGDIGPSWSDDELTDKTVSSSLKKLKDQGAKDLYVHVNSGGGNVFHGMAIYNTIKAWNGKKIAIIDGLAGSISSLIVMACDEIRMGKASMMLIHEPRMPAYGREKEIKQAAVLLSKIRDTMVSVYMEKTGHDKVKIEKLLADETWMTAPEAVTEKFATSVIETDDEEVEAHILDSASAIFSQYKNIPNHVRAIMARAHYTAPVRPTKENKMELTILASLLGLPATASEGECRAKLVSLATVSAVVEPMKIAASDMAELMMITGKPSGAEAKGIIMAWKVSHEKVAQLTADQARRDEEDRNNKVVATVDAAVTAGKIPPAMKEFWLTEGRKSLVTLEAFVSQAPVSTTQLVNPKPPEITGLGVIALTPEQQESMFKAAGISDPKLKDAIRAKVVEQNKMLNGVNLTLPNTRVA